jgi:hypothetical protein
MIFLAVFQIRRKVSSVARRNAKHQPTPTMKTPRQPQQTAKLVKVIGLRDRKTLVKHISAQFTSYWILSPSIGGGECPMVFVDRVRTRYMLPCDEAKITRLAEIAVSPRNPSTLDGLDVKSLIIA